MELNHLRIMITVSLIGSYKILSFIMTMIISLQNSISFFITQHIL